MPLLTLNDFFFLLFLICLVFLLLGFYLVFIFTYFFPYRNILDFMGANTQTKFPLIKLPCAYGSKNEEIPNNC